jgi:flagellar protein FlaG
MINSISNIVNFPTVPEIKPKAQAVSPITPSSPEAGLAAKTKSTPEKSSPKPSTAQVYPNYMLKLTVDKDPNTGEYVYKAIDRVTGEVIRQLPRKELLEMRKSSAYQAGSVIKTDV